MGLSGHADPAAVLGVTISFTIIAVLAVVLRLYSRIFLVHSPGKDDAFIVAAAAMTVCLTIAQGFQVKYGMGRHLASLTDFELITSLKPFWASIVIYNLGLFLTKFSILLQYLRIFPYRTFRTLNYCLMVFIFAWSCWTVFSSIFFCKPVAFFWDKSIERGTCLSQWAVWFANAGVNIVTDILVATLPLPFLSQLQLPKKQRIALMVVFALGGFTCIISILRLQSLLVFLQTSDISWHNPLAAIWSSLEVNIGITCSCLPTLKSLVSRWFPRAFHSSSYMRDSDHCNEHRERERQGGEGAHTGSSGSSSNPSKASNRFALDTLGPRGATHQTVIQSGRDKRARQAFGEDDDSLEEIEFGAVRDKQYGERSRAQIEDEHIQQQRGIQVVTIVEQEVEKGYPCGGGGGGTDAKSDVGSERELVRRPRKG